MADGFTVETCVMFVTNEFFDLGRSQLAAGSRVLFEDDRRSVETPCGAGPTLTGRSSMPVNNGPTSLAGLGADQLLGGSPFK